MSIGALGDLQIDDDLRPVNEALPQRVRIAPGSRLNRKRPEQ